MVSTIWIDPENTRSKPPDVAVSCHMYWVGAIASSPAVQVTVTFGVPDGSLPAPAAPVIPDDLVSSSREHESNAR